MNDPADDITCSITGLIFLNPVVISDGHVYEKDAILEWFLKNNTSPNTGLVLSNKSVFPCLYIKNAVKNFLKNNPKRKIDQYIGPFSENDFLEKYAIDTTDALEYLQLYKNIIIDSVISDIFKDSRFVFCFVDNNIRFRKIKLFDEIYRNGSIDTIKYMVETLGLDVGSSNDDGDYPIHLVCISNSIEVIEYILSEGGNIESVGSEKMKPIHYACQCNSDDVIKYLIGKGIDLECEDSMRWRPLHYICYFRNIDMMKYIINKKVETRSTIDGYKEIPDNATAIDIIIKKKNIDFNLADLLNLALNIA